MTYFESLLLGIIQGLTEFIPVSSTAHLLIGQHLLGIQPGPAMFSFLVIVQLGTLVSLVVYFWKDITRLVRAFFARPFSTPENKLAWLIIIATLPALLAGYFLRSAVQFLFNTPLLEASIRLFSAALLMTLAEWLTKKTRQLDSLTWLDALFIGIFQVLAIFPGASRSGTTIAAGMFRGLDRPSAARFAFLMSLPVMLAAGGYELLDVFQQPGLGSTLPLLTVGFISAAIVGWFAVRWLIAYLSRRSLIVFAVYCAALGLLTVLLQII